MCTGLTSVGFWRAASSPAASRLVTNRILADEQDQHGEDHRTLERAPDRFGAQRANRSASRWPSRSSSSAGRWPRWKRRRRSSLSSFKARLFWLGKQPFAKGKTYKLKLATQEVECTIESIDKVIDASTLATVGPRGCANVGGPARSGRIDAAHQKADRLRRARGHCVDRAVCDRGWV